MRRIYIEDAIERLEQYGFMRSEILKMKLDKFISTVNIYIGTVESIEFEKRKSLGKQHSTDGKWTTSESLF